MIGLRQLVPDALSATDCARIIGRARALGFSSAASAYPPSYRNNDRLVIDDPDLADRLFGRLCAHLPATVDEAGSSWELVGLNPRFRLCRYHAGQRFSIHRDGAQHRGDDEKTLLTFMVYLNDASEFEGGDTRFFASRDPDGPVTARVTPRAGTLVVFDHTAWHDGAPVTAGEKLILRSDIFYRRTRGAGPVGHQGYVWSAVLAADGTVLTGSRDRTIRRWEVGPEGLRALATGAAAHRSSVLALVEARPGEVWSADRDGLVRRWSTSDPRRALGPPVEAHAGAVLSLGRLDSGLVVSSGADGTVALWTPEGRLAERVDLGAGWVWSVAQQPDGTLVAGCEDGTVHAWRRGVEPRRLYHGDVPVKAVLALAGALLVGLADGRILRLGEEGPVETWSGHTGAVRALTALSDGRVASGAEDDTVRLWGPATGTSTPIVRHRDFVTTIAALPDGRFVTGSYDGQVSLHESSGSTVID